MSSTTPTTAFLLTVTAAATTVALACPSASAYIPRERDSSAASSTAPSVGPSIGPSTASSTGPTATSPYSPQLTALSGGNLAQYLHTHASAEMRRREGGDPRDPRSRRGCGAARF